MRTLAGLVLLAGAPALGAQPEGSVTASNPDPQSPAAPAAASSVGGEPGGTSAAPARAETIDEAPARLSFSITPQGSYTFASDLRGDADGDASVGRAGVAFNAGYRLDDVWQLTLSVTPEWSWYDLDSSLIGDDDLRTLEVNVSPGVNVRLAERWSLRIAGLIDHSAETGAGGDAITYGGLVGVRYQWSKTFATTWGVVVTSRLEDDVFVFPILGMEWAISDRVRLSSKGLGLELAVDLCDTLTAKLSGAYEPREFRLDRHQGDDDRVLRDRRVPVAVGLSWKPCRSFEASLTGGAVVWQEFVLDDADGDEIRTARTRPAGFIGGGVTFRF